MNYEVRYSKTRAERRDPQSMVIVEVLGDAVREVAAFDSVHAAHQALRLVFRPMLAKTQVEKARLLAEAAEYLLAEVRRLRLETESDTVELRAVGA